MTGSALAPFIIPIVAVITLVAWLAMVYFADVAGLRRQRKTLSGRSRR
jgi:hypothetical protein